MKKIVILGSILICFLMLMIPQISAIEYQTIITTSTESTLDVDENQLKEAIIKRLQQMNKPMISGMDFTDPDGPLHGGLDDSSDLLHLFQAVLSGFWFILKIDAGWTYLTAGSFSDVLILMLVDGSITLSMLIDLGEAFDVYESPFYSDGL